MCEIWSKFDKNVEKRNVPNSSLDTQNGNIYNYCSLKKRRVIDMRVIFDSNSPRRVAIMKLAEIEFEVLPSRYEEKIDTNINVEEQSQMLAYGKAKEVFDRTQGNRAIIGADTIVVKDGHIYGKPIDKIDAIKMLKKLQGDKHTVYTSISILIENDGKVDEYNETIKTDILLHKMTDEEIEDYIDKEAPYDKAGSYAIQSSFCKYIDNINGNYMSVIGLPIDRVYQILKENDVI